jgi:hypothetical protein
MRVLTRNGFWAELLLVGGKRVKAPLASEYQSYLEQKVQGIRSCSLTGDLIAANPK